MIVKNYRDLVWQQVKEEDCNILSKRYTPNATCFEHFNFSSEEFLSMLRFDQRGKLEELQEKIDRTGQDDR